MATHSEAAKRKMKKKHHKKGFNPFDKDMNSANPDAKDKAAQKADTFGKWLAKKKG
jgi:hypothetical protein